MGCLKLAAVAAAVHGLWTIRNRSIHGDRPPDIVAFIRRWLADISPLIKAPYRASLRSELCLSSVHLLPPSTRFKRGLWISRSAWTRPTLSMALSPELDRVGAISRDLNGNLVWAVQLKPQAKGFLACVASLLNMIAARGLQVDHFECSHPSTWFLLPQCLSSPVGGGVWWRHIRASLPLSSVHLVCPSLTRSASILASIRHDQDLSFFNSPNELPPPVRMAYFAECNGIAYFCNQCEYHQNL